ncbi:MAG: dihydrodipicolinate synthase family protein [Rubrivivax sp.]
MSPAPTPDATPMQGLWPAMVTPLDEALAIDHARFAAHARDLLACGCAGVTPFGTTGEGPSFSVDERRHALDALVDGGVAPQQIVASTSAAALPDAVALTRHAVERGVRACLLMPPFFLKGVPDAGIVDFYDQLVDRVADARLRLVLYHIPQVSGVALGEGVVATLLQHHGPHIVGIKDSGGQRDTSLGFARAFMPPLQVWVGHEPDLQELATMGARGAISGLGNVAPRLVQRLLAGPDAPDAAADLQRVQQVLALLNADGLTASYKAVLAQRSGHAGWRRVRAPLVAMDDAQAARLAAAWGALDAGCVG